MALRVTLGELIESVRAEAELSTNTSRGIDHLENIKRLIRRQYNLIATGHDWQHLKVRHTDATVQMQAGSRHYNFPVNLDTQQIGAVYFRWGNLWHRVSYGIGAGEYSHLDPLLDQRADPVVKWDFYSNAALNQFEVWPLPASDEGLIGFEGKKAVEQLVDSSNRADIDSDLIVLSVAAIILNNNDKESKAREKEAAYIALRDRLLGALSDRRRIVVGGNDPKMGAGGTRPREIKYIR